MSVAASDWGASFGAVSTGPSGSIRAERPAQLVLTRRGRVVAAILVALVIAFVAVLFGSSVAANQGAASDIATATVVVEAGDTLWGIAADANPTGDIRQTVNEIIHLNALESGSKLPVGAKLLVPAPR